MSAKQPKFGIASRERMIEGASIRAAAVNATLGPKGRNVLVHKAYGAPAITKDGVSVAKEGQLEDPFEDVAGLMITTEAMIAPVPEEKRPVPDYPPM